MTKIIWTHWTLSIKYHKPAQEIEVSTQSNSQEINEVLLDNIWVEN